MNINQKCAMVNQVWGRMGLESFSMFVIKYMSYSYIIFNVIRVLYIYIY